MWAPDRARGGARRGPVIFLLQLTCTTLAATSSSLFDRVTPARSAATRKKLELMLSPVLALAKEEDLYTGGEGKGVYTERRGATRKELESVLLPVLARDLSTGEGRLKMKWMEGWGRSYSEKAGLDVVALLSTGEQRGHASRGGGAKGETTVRG
jgi:hypothetical protein